MNSPRYNVGQLVSTSKWHTITMEGNPADVMFRVEPGYDEVIARVVRHMASSPVLFCGEEEVDVPTTYIYVLKTDDIEDEIYANECDIRRVTDTPEGWEPKESK